jgi:hypothetical protein
MVISTDLLVATLTNLTLEEVLMDLQLNCVSQCSLKLLRSVTLGIDSWSFHLLLKSKQVYKANKSHTKPIQVTMKVILLTMLLLTQTQSRFLVAGDWEGRALGVSVKVQSSSSAR